MLGRVALVGFKVDVGIVVLLVVLLDSRLILDSPLRSISRGLSSCNPSSSMKRKKIPFFSFFKSFLHKRVTVSLRSIFHTFRCYYQHAFVTRFRRF